MKSGIKRSLGIVLCSMLMVLAMAFPVSASTKVDAPKYFRVESVGNLSVNLRWSKNFSVSGYELYQYDSASRRYKKIRTLSKNSYTCTVKNLKSGKTYKYLLKAYKKQKGKKYLSKASNKISVKAKKLSESVLSVRRPYYTVKTKKSVTVWNKTLNRTVTLKKGTKLAVTAKSGTTVNGYLKNGDRVSIKRKYLKYTGLDVDGKKDYSKALKQEFVNSKGYTSNTDWLIWVSERTCKVYVYKGSRGKWKLKKTYPCCVGRWQNRTSSGVRSILKKEWSNTYNGYVLYFSSGTGTTSNPNGCAFHPKVDNRMGKAISHGCIRMERSDLNYLYRNCPVGTRVVVY